jgi:hypothetical protein
MITLKIIKEYDCDFQWKFCKTTETLLGPKYDMLYKGFIWGYWQFFVLKRKKDF